MNPQNLFKRTPGSANSPSPARVVEATGSSRTPVYVDDETLHRMIESFGPLEYSQFTSTLAHGAYANVGEQQDPFGAGLNWQGELEWQSQEMGARRKSRSPRTEHAPAPPYMLPQTQMEGEASNPKSVEAKKETLMEWFDRSVEKELEKRRKSMSPAGAAAVVAVDPALAPLKAKHALHLSKGATERLAEACASGVEITARLETDFTTELTDAVEKFAKAEAMCSYAVALQAAEEAAQNAPPELVEQAAAAGARRVQTQLSRVEETIPGVRPIEVVGYVGITKPHHPKKST